MLLINPKTRKNNLMSLFARGVKHTITSSTGCNDPYTTSSEDVRTLCKEGRLKEAVHILCRAGNLLDFSSCLCLLQGCIENKALSHGKLIQAFMAKVGFTGNLILQNTLSNMYVKCGSLEDARQVFDKMTERDVFSWTVMIAAYARQGFIEEALALFKQMLGTGIQPNQFTFATVISACADVASLEQGTGIHGKILTSEFADDVVVGNALIDMYTNCRRIEEAREVFDKMPLRDLVSWNSMIAGYAQTGLMDMALELFEEMPQRDVVSWNSMIAGYSQIGLVDEALKLFRKMPRQNIVSWTALIGGYARNGLVDDALRIFKEMPQKNLVSWNALIAGFAQSGCDEESLKLFQQMQLEGVRSDSATFSCILPACAKLKAIQLAKQIHGKIIRTRFHYHIMVVNALIDMYGKCGNIDKASILFDKVHQPDDVSWTSMVSGYAQNGLVEEALKLFKEMPQPNLVAWNALIAGVARNGQCKKALELFQEMQLMDVRPDAKTLTSMLQVCSGLTALRYGMEIHEIITRSGLEYDLLVMTTLINMYAQCGSMVKAQKLFEKMHQHDLVTWNVIILGYVENGLVDEALKQFNKMPQQNTAFWNALIAGFAKHGYDEEAVKLFQQMQLVGLCPDARTFASILSVCANLAALEQGSMIHAKVLQNGFLFDLVVINSLIHMYAKCGSIDKAKEMFDKMHDRDVVSWNAMIAGYAMHGCGKEAVKLFEEMKYSGMNPDHVTLVSVLSACNHAGLVDEAYHYFQCIDHFNIRPTTEHYICMVDLLGRVGHLNAAQDFIYRMPIKPDPVVWSCFLSACRIHKNIELGECIAEHLFELDLKDAAPYVLLSNIYAAAGRWDNIEKVRKMMKNRGIRKKPGCSWIEVNKQVHVFLVQDKSHSQTHIQS